jgi:hypothetical protein
MLQNEPVKPAGADDRKPAAGEEAEHEHSVQGGKLLRVSVSQIKTFDDTKPEGCNRKWYYERVLHRPRKKFAFQELGTRVHAQIEQFLKTGQNVAELDSLTAAAMSYRRPKDGRPLLPTPGPDLRIEAPIDGNRLSVPLLSHTVKFSGFMDVQFCRDPAMPEVHDHKTTSDIAKWADNEETLKTDIQAHVYMMDAVLRWPTARAVRYQKNYLQTKKLPVKDRVSGSPWKVSMVDTVTPVDKIQNSWLTVKHKVALMNAAAGAPNVEEVKAAEDIRACRAYGGCPFANECSQAPHKREAMDLIDLLGIEDEQAAPPAPAAQPATAAATGPQHLRTRGHRACGPEVRGHH